MFAPGGRIARSAFEDAPDDRGFPATACIPRISTSTLSLSQGRSLPHSRGEKRSTAEQADLRAPTSILTLLIGRAKSALGAPQWGQPRDWRDRGMGKGLVSERDLNPHVPDLRLCVPEPYQEKHDRRSGTCTCVRGDLNTKPREISRDRGNFHGPSLAGWRPRPPGVHVLRRGACRPRPVPGPDSGPDAEPGGSR